jgi:hypothetical protein
MARSSIDQQVIGCQLPSPLLLGLEQDLLPNDGVDGSRSRRCQDEPV